MKKLRSKSKSGFTLLEVLLATVIMVIASTMIMQGFIAVMVLGGNNRSFAKSGENNYRMAMNQTLVAHATSGDQISSIGSLEDDKFSWVTGSGSGYTVNLLVDVSSYSSSDASYTYNVGGEDVDADPVTNNRFAFFYDFGDYMNRDGGHIMRYGYTIDPAHPTTSTTYYYLAIRDDSGTVVAYGHPGWYCFNSDHDGQTCRTDPYTTVRAVGSST